MAPDKLFRTRPGSVALAALLIVLAALAAYSDSFRGPFVFDDVPAILENATLRHASTAFRPPPDTTASGRPVLNASLALNYAVSGLSVWSYHALNLLIHIGAGLVLFGIVRRTLERRKTADAVLVAFAAALFWTLHPLQTEAVTYVVQRAESLMGLFYLLTLYCFIRGARLCPPDAGSAAAVEPNLWFGLSWLACLLGMAAKEVMVTAPVMVFLYDRTFVAGSFREAWAKRKGTYLGLAATWVLLGVLVASTGGNRSGTAGLVAFAAWPSYWLTQFAAVCHYLRLAIRPGPLAFDYGVFRAHFGAALAARAVLVGALLAAALIALRRRSALGFLGAWFFGILALTCFVPSQVQMIVEHRMYLSLAALAVLAALGLARLVKILPKRWHEAAMLGLTLAVGAGLGRATYERNRDYRSEIALWADTARKRPNDALAHANLALALFRIGQGEKAAAEDRIALRLRPDSALTWYNLGNVLAGEGDWKVAADCYRSAAQLQPDNAWPRYNWGNSLLRLGRPAEAVDQYRLAIQLDSSEASFHHNLGFAFARLGRFSEAAGEYRAALRLRPDDAGSLAGLEAVERRLQSEPAASHP